MELANSAAIRKHTRRADVVLVLRAWWISFPRLSRTRNSFTMAARRGCSGVSKRCSSTRARSTMRARRPLSTFSRVPIPVRRIRERSKAGSGVRCHQSGSWLLTKIGRLSWELACPALDCLASLVSSRIVRMQKTGATPIRRTISKRVAVMSMASFLAVTT